MVTSKSINMETIDAPENLRRETFENLREKSEIKNKWFYLGMPVVAVAFAEVCVSSGRLVEAAIIYAVILLGLSFSMMFIKNEEIQKTYQAFILLPILRLINLSMPVFFESTLDSFIFIYCLMSIPVSIAAAHQDFTRTQLGLTFNKLILYVPLSLFLGVVLGAGEYLIIGTHNLIPDLSVFNIIKLSIVMIFFAGLVEELIFRSILQTRLQIVLGDKKGLILMAILFGLMHSGYGSFIEVLYASFVGLFIGLLFYRTRSLPLVMMIHGFINIFVFGVFPFLL
jgi:membrane protease YdiL (CAAX protease family)